MVDTTALSSDVLRPFHLVKNLVFGLLPRGKVLVDGPFPSHALLSARINVSVLCRLACPFLPARSSASSLPILTVAAEMLPPS